MIRRATVWSPCLIHVSFAMALAWQVGCAPMSDYDMIGFAVTVIRDGDGYRKPFGSSRDFFTIHLEALEHPTQRLREAAVINVPSNVGMPARYPLLLDAYIDYGPIDRLGEVLFRAWQRARPGTKERWRMGMAFLDMKARRYLWAHPEAAEEVGAKRREPPHKGYKSIGWENFTKYLLAECDEQFREVWLDYQENVKLLREGKLEPVRPWEKRIRGAPHKEEEG